MRAIVGREASIIRQPELNCHLSCNYLLTIFSCLCLTVYLEHPGLSIRSSPSQPWPAPCLMSGSNGIWGNIEVFSVSLIPPLISSYMYHVYLEHYTYHQHHFDHLNYSAKMRIFWASLWSSDQVWMLQAVDTLIRVAPTGKWTNSDINPPSSRYATTYHEKVLWLFWRNSWK